MPIARFLTYNDRAYRREKVIAAYKRDGDLRKAAEQYGVSYKWARQFVRLADVPWPPRRWAA